MVEKTVLFHLHYKTWDNETVVIQYGSSEENLNNVMYGHSYDGENWSVALNIKTSLNIWYRYMIYRGEEVSRIEQGDVRFMDTSKLSTTNYINDFWRSKERSDSIFFSSAFKDVIFRRNSITKTSLHSGKKNLFVLSLNAVNIPKKYALGVTGNKPFLGNWSEPVALNSEDFPIWKTTFEMDNEKLNIEYKYVIFQKETKEILEWESGENRVLNINFPNSELSQFHQNDEIFNFRENWWRGAGIAIPVFSLRTKNSFGIGEFSDLKQMIDFASLTKMNIVQVLPVNDTIARKTWRDSYPYSAISVFALHPLYINIDEIAPFKNKSDQASYESDKMKLNSYQEINFEEVLAKKMHYFRILFAQTKTSFQKKEAFKKFLKTNESWLDSYAAFCALRDHFGTADFNVWPKYKRYNEDEITSLIKKDKTLNSEVLFYKFLQFYADNQLRSSNKYGKAKGVVLKGDLPIGIYRNSADAWVAPELYNMEEQAGAPPDAYAVLGQNWGFPTYKWTEMAKNNFAWWRKRMVNLSYYFDALRIDHILGFFRIWQIPIQEVQGTLGLFNPRIPYSIEELKYFGLNGDIKQYTIPYITEAVLNNTFGEEAVLIKSSLLTQNTDSTYSFKDEFPNQKSIQSFILSSKNRTLQKHVQNILTLFSEVLLIEEPGSTFSAFNPRITLQTTRYYQSLEAQEKYKFDKLYIDYYYRRHEGYWKAQALWKIPALLEATNMSICGEDLGMIPDSVPEVMAKLNIIPLEIQRMPKGPRYFGLVSDYPYYSVCSPSCHDMSTIRGWWKADKKTTQLFYNDYIQINGQAPSQAGANEVEFIIQDHLNSNSILAIFPIQDLLGIDDTLKRSNIDAEQINDPSNPDHNWKYRLHLNMEDLLEAKSFILKIKTMVENSGRDN